MQRDIDYIKQTISNWGQCKSMALTTNAAVAIVGVNGYAYSGDIPQDFIDTLAAIRSKNMSIDDIVLKEDGGWLIIYDGNHRVRGEMIPNALISKLKLVNIIFSADWCKASNGYIHSFISSPELQFEYDYFKKILVNWRGTYCCLYDGRYLHYCHCNNNSIKDELQRHRVMLDDEYITHNLIDGKLSPSDLNTGDVSSYFYPIINGYVKNVHRVKLFYEGRYFVANENGTEYYYYI